MSLFEDVKNELFKNKQAILDDLHRNYPNLIRRTQDVNVNPVKELTVEEISKRLGYEVKVVKS